MTAIKGIVLTEEQNTGLMRTREKFKPLLDELGIWFETREMINGKYFINEDIVRKPGFIEIAKYLDSIRAMDNLEIRHIDQSEFIEYTIISK